MGEGGQKPCEHGQDLPEAAGHIWGPSSWFLLGPEGPFPGSVRVLYPSMASQCSLGKFQATVWVPWPLPNPQPRFASPTIQHAHPKHCISLHGPAYSPQSLCTDGTFCLPSTPCEAQPSGPRARARSLPLSQGVPPLVPPVTWASGSHTWPPAHVGALSGRAGMEPGIL